MVDRVVTAGDVTLDEPRGPAPGMLDFPQRGMAAAPFPERGRMVREPRLVVRIQKHAHHLPDQLAGPGRQAQRAELPVLLRDIDAAHRREPVFLLPHQPGDPVDLRLGHAVRGLTVSPRRHRPLVGVDAPVGHQVQVLVEHLSVELIARQAFPAALAEDFKYHFGFLHYAYLAVLAIQSPVPLRPVVRLSRSPDWQAVTPATTTGTPSPRIARAPGSIPRSHRCTCRA